MTSAVEKTNGVNIVDGDNGRNELSSIKSCGDGSTDDCAGSIRASTPTITTSSSTIVEPIPTSTTAVPNVATNDSIMVRDLASNSTSGDNNGGGGTNRIHSPKKKKANRELKNQSPSTAVANPSSTLDGVEKRIIKQEQSDAIVDGQPPEKSIDEKNSNAQAPLDEEIIDGFAFTSFAQYEDLEEWVRREEETLRQILQLSDGGDAEEAAGACTSSSSINNKASSSTTTTPADSTPKRKCRKNKENKMAMLALSMKESDNALNGNNGTSALIYASETCSINSRLGNNITKMELSQTSSQSMVQILNNDRTSPSLLRPKSTSAAFDSALPGQSSGSTIGATTSRINKRPANNGVAIGVGGGDHATDLSVPAAKVPKRENVDTVPGAAGNHQQENHHQQLSLKKSSSSPQARSNSSLEMNDPMAAVLKRSGLVSPSSTAMINNRTIQSAHLQHTNQLVASPSSSKSPSFASGIAPSGEKIFNKDSVDPASNPLSSPLAAALSHAMSSASKAGGSTGTPSSAQHRPDFASSSSSHLAAAKPATGIATTAASMLPQASSALFPSLGGAGGLFSTPTGVSTAAAMGTPAAYFHTEMHQHQHTHMHQYPPFLPPFLNAGLQGIPGMAGLPGAYGGIPGFPMAPQVPGLPPLPTPSTSSSNSMSQVPAKKKGKWCAMHVQIAWDIYNKTKASRREKKGEDDGQNNHASTSTSANSNASSSVVFQTSNAASSVQSSSSTVGQAHSVPRPPLGFPSAPTHGANAASDKNNQVRLSSDPNRDQRRREKEKERERERERTKSNSIPRPADIESINRVHSAHNGIQQPPPTSSASLGGRESTKLPIDHRGSNGAASLGHRTPSTIAQSPSSTMLPLKTETPNTSLPLFQDGLLSRQQQAHLFNSVAPGLASSIAATLASTAASNSLPANTADGLFRNSTAAIGGRPPMSSIPPTSYATSATSYGNLAAAVAAADRLRAVTPSSINQAALSGSSGLDAAYRTLMGLDNATLGRGIGGGYDSALFRPPFAVDPLMFEREREQLIRLQQHQLLSAAAAAAAAGHPDHHVSSASAVNPLASMIDLERAMSRPSMMNSIAPGLFAQSSMGMPPSTIAGQQQPTSAAMFNAQLFGGLDSATAAAAAAAAASLYSSGLFQRERMELEQRLFGSSANGAQFLPGASAADPLRLGFLGAGSSTNPLMDPYFSARAAALGNAAVGFPPNFGMNFGLTPPGARSSMAPNHLPPSSSAATTVGSMAPNNLGSPFSNSLEQLARQKRDALLASAAAAAAAGVPSANMFQNR